MGWTLIGSYTKTFNRNLVVIRVSFVMVSIKNVKACVLGVRELGLRLGLISTMDGVLCPLSSALSFTLLNSTQLRWVPGTAEVNLQWTSILSTGWEGGHSVCLKECLLPQAHVQIPAMTNFLYAWKLPHFGGSLQVLPFPTLFPNWLRKGIFLSVGPYRLARCQYDVIRVVCNVNLRNFTWSEMLNFSHSSNSLLML